MTNTKQKDWEKEFVIRFPHDTLGYYPDHAPMHTHHPETGECMECPIQASYTEDIIAFIQTLLTQQKKEIVEVITKYDLIPVQVREENPYYWDGHKKTIEIITNLLTKEDDK